MNPPSSDVISSESLSKSQVDEDFVERNYKHNFIVNFLDGSSFWFGYSFIAPSVILPLYVSHFTNNDLVIGLVAVINGAGYFLPQIFTANWVQKFPRKKVLPVNLGFFLERLPIFLLAPTALFFSHSMVLAISIFLLLFAWHSFGAGTVSVAWQDMIAKVIPLNRRGRFMGITNFGGTATGILGAALTAWLLDRYVFPYGFVACFALAAVFIFFSWISLALTREPAVLSRQPRITHREYWKNLPNLLQKDRNFQRFIFGQIIVNLGGMAWGFLAVYATQRWDLPDGTVGGYTASMMIGQAVANLLFGMLADRKGYKIIIEISILLSVLALLISFLAPMSQWFNFVFFIRGAGAAGFMLAMLFVFEFSTPEMRPTYIGLSNTLSGIALGVSPLAGGWLAETLGYQELFLVAMIISILGFVIMHWAVKDPRNTVVEL
jgi:MFS family permease